MKLRNLRIIGVVGLAAISVAGCGSLIKGDPDERWVGYKSWTKLTESRTGTGDPTGFLGNVHKGREGYRDVFVNAAGRAMLTGTGPYEFPAGTIIVKEQYSNKAAWEAQKGADLTVMLKIKDGAGADTWNWAAGLTGKAGENNFCSACHAIASKDDYVFTHEKFLSTL